MQKKLWAGILYTVAACGLGASIHAAPIMIPDGDFSAGGSISGLTSHTNTQFGASPWFGTNTGILTLLPPSLSVGSGSASINGLIGVNVLGVISNT